MNTRQNVPVNHDWRITDWRATVYQLVERWGASNRMPTPWEWDQWTKAVHEAAQARSKSGWVGRDPLYEAAYDDGYAAAMAQVEEETGIDPAGSYPYA